MRVKIFILFVFLSVHCLGQTITYQGIPTQTIVTRGVSISDSLLVVPIRQTSFPSWYPNTLRKEGSVVISPSTNQLSWYSGGTWRTAATGGNVDSSVYKTVYRAHQDSLALANATLVNANILDSITYSGASPNLFTGTIRVGNYWSTSNGSNQTNATWRSTTKFNLAPATRYSVQFIDSLGVAGTRSDLISYKTGGTFDSLLAKNTIAGCTGCYTFLTSNNTEQIAFNVSSTSQGGFASTLMLNLGSTLVTPYVPPGGSNTRYIDSAALPNYLTASQTSALIKSSTVTTGDIEYKTTKYTAYVRTYWDTLSDGVQSFDTTNNGATNIRGFKTILKTDSITATGSSIYNPNPGDNTAPLQFTYLGNLSGNHGVEVIKVRSVAHGKTTADIGSRYTDGTYKYFIIQINGVDSLTLMGAPYLFGSETIYRRSSLASPTLTNDSGGVNTAPFTTTFTIADQKFPSIKNKGSNLYIDGIWKNRTAASGRCNLFEIIDTFEVVDPTTITVTNPFSPSNGLPLARMVITYRIGSNGIMNMNYQVFPLIPHLIRNIGIVQPQKLTTFGTYSNFNIYVPNSKPIIVGDSTYFFNRGQLLNNAVDNIYLTKAYVIDTNYTINRTMSYMTNSSGQKGVIMVQGYNQVLGSTKNSSRKENNASEYLYISTAEKQYLRTYSGYTWSSPLYGVAYYGFVNPAVNDNLITSYTVNSGVNNWLLYIDIKRAASNYTIKVPSSLNNLPIKIIEKQGNVSLITSEAVVANSVIVSATDSGGYFVLSVGGILN